MEEQINQLIRKYTHSVGLAKRNIKEMKEKNQDRTCSYQTEKVMLLTWKEFLKELQLLSDKIVNDNQQGHRRTRNS